MRKILLTTLVALLVSAAMLSAQDKKEAKARLTGYIIDAITRAPIPAAIARIDGLNRAIVVDASGGFAFEDLPRGALFLEIARLGYADETLDLRLKGDDTLTVELKPLPDVQAAIPRLLQQLQTRRQRTVRTVRVFDAASLATTPATLRNFLRPYAGAIVSCRDRFGTDDNCITSGNGYAPLRVFIDDLYHAGAQLDLYEAHQFELVEYYRSGMVRLYTKAFLERVARGKAILTPSL